MQHSATNLPPRFPSILLMIIAEYQERQRKEIRMQYAIAEARRLPYNQAMIEKREYIIADLDVIKADPEMVLSGSLDEEIRDRMAKVVETEAPIREALLYKRVINSLSMKKVGSRIEPVFRRIALSLPYERTEENGEMVFHDGPEDFFRTSIGSDRYSYQIPIAEAAACILYILEKENRIITKSELVILFRNELGYERLGAQVDALFRAAAKDGRIGRTGNGRFKP